MADNLNIKKGSFLLYFSKNNGFFLNNKESYSHFLKHKIGDYIIHIKSDEKIFHDTRNNIDLIIKGNIFSENKLDKYRYTVSMYLKYSTDFINKINGHFFIVLLDKKNDQLHIFTDRLNTYKLFYTNNNNQFIFSDSIFNFSSLNRKPNIKLIGFYLANGFLINNKSLIEDVDVTYSAFQLSLTSENHIFNKYWTPKFTETYKNVTIKELQDQLCDLLIKSIKRRLLNSNTINISLSGGYDISAILAILKFNLKHKNANCFSYYYDKIPENSDCSIANKQAYLCNYNFFCFKSFSSNLSSHIFNNSIWGQGISNYCEEIDFWNTYSNHVLPSNSILFFGEEFFGFRPSNIKTAKDLISALNLSDYKSLKKYESYFSNTFLLKLKNGFDDSFKDIIQTFNKKNDSFNNFSIQYFNIRLTNIMTSWRQYFANRFSETANPFLDYEIIDFILKLPKKMRMNKRLFIDTIKLNHPNLFSIPRATNNNNIDNWTFLLHSNKKDINLLLENKSILDDYISKNMIHDLLDKKTSNWTKLRKLLLVSQKIFNKFSPLKIKLIKDFTGKHDLIKRYLVLRSFYNEYFE